MDIRSACTLFAMTLVAGTAQAQLIQPVEQLRVVQTVASVTDSNGTQTDLLNELAPDFGEFSQSFNSSINLPGFEATAEASASQSSQILSNAILAEATFDADPDVSASGVSAEASGSSYVSVTFEIGVPVTYSLTGELTQTAGAAVATLLVQTQSIEQFVSFDGTVPVNGSGTLLPGLYTLELQAAGIATSTPGSDGETSGGYSIQFVVTSQVPSFCDGSDGALASCPCGNPGSPTTGCDLSQSTGGVSLDLVAQETSPSNSAEWFGEGFPPNGTPATVLIRSNSIDPASPVVFGDGLRCIGTPVVRLSTAFAIGGTATHTAGHGAPPGDYNYQLWFRNTPTGFCDPTAAFNLSNGRTATW